MIYIFPGGRALTLSDSYFQSRVRDVSWNHIFSFSAKRKASLQGRQQGKERRVRDCRPLSLSAPTSAPKESRRRSRLVSSWACAIVGASVCIHQRRGPHTSSFAATRISEEKLQKPVCSSLKLGWKGRVKRVSTYAWPWC